MMQHYESWRKIMDSYSRGTDSFELQNYTARLMYLSSQVLQYDGALPTYVLLVAERGGTGPPPVPVESPRPLPSAGSGARLMEQSAN